MIRRNRKLLFLVLSICSSVFLDGVHMTSWYNYSSARMCPSEIHRPASEQDDFGHWFRGQPEQLKIFCASCHRRSTRFFVHTNPRLRTHTIENFAPPKSKAKFLSCMRQAFQKIRILWASSGGIAWSVRCNYRQDFVLLYRFLLQSMIHSFSDYGYQHAVFSL